MSPHSMRAKRSSRFDQGVLWLGLVCWVSAGCAGPSKDATRGAGASTTSRGAVVAPSKQANLPAKASDVVLPVSVWVTRAFDGAPQEQVLQAIRGREQGYFLEVIERVGKEARDVSGVVRGAARGLSENGGTAGAAVVVRELWARECCMRRGFLAAGLLGLVDGLEARYAGPVQDTATATMLEALAGHADPDVAAAARMAIPYFMRE